MIDLLTLQKIKMLEYFKTRNDERYWLMAKPKLTPADETADRSGETTLISL